MGGSAKVLGCAAVLRRALVAVVAPRRIFRGISRREAPPWGWLALVVVIVGAVDAVVHPFVAWGLWLFEVFPRDWVPFAIGWALFDLNQWLLVTLLFAALERLRVGRVTGLPAFGVAGFYVTAGLWAIPAVVDPLHRLLRVAPLELQIPWLGWWNGPVFGYAGRFSHLVVFPWVSLALWHAMVHLLDMRMRREQGAAIILAIITPLSGRLIIEHLPNVVVRWSSGQFDVSFSAGSAVLLTHALLALVSGVAIWMVCGAPGADAAIEPR